MDDLSLSHLYEEVEEEEEEEIGEREGSKEEGEEEQLPTSTTELAAVDETAQDPAYVLSMLSYAKSSACVSC